MSSLDWTLGLENAVNYIENHLLEPVDLDEVAKAAGCSTFHFLRVFNILTGFTVGEYIRNRRLTLAGQELALSEAKVIDIALKYGYETHESFTKAFRRFHGISPSATRKPGAVLKSFGKLSVQVVLKGETAMNYRFVEKEAFKVVGKKAVISNQNGENFKTIPKFWNTCFEDGTVKALEKACVDKMGVMGICANFKKDCFDYYIAANCGANPPEGMICLEIPKFTWVVFEAVGPIPGAIQDIWKKIFSEWLPTNEYEHDNGPELEVYGPGDPSKADYKSYVWIPVIKKSK